MDVLSEEIPRGVGGPVAFPVIAILSVFLAASAVGLAAREKDEHPVLKPEEVNSESCLACHAGKRQGTVAHKALEMGCETCHEVKSDESGFHISLIALKNELCLTCHADKGPDSATRLQTHSPVLRGDCAACHDPHSSPNEFLLLRPREGKTKEENLCLSCHPRIASLLAAKVQHSAVEAGCGACHQTHKAAASGDQQFQFHLAKPAPELCLDCHEVADPKLREAHQNQPFEKSKCTECHNPHGSDRAKLINTFAHAPFEEKQCDICHSPPSKGKVVVNQEGKRALCYICHDDIKTQIENAKVPHSLFRKRDFCTDCHSPHAASYPHQLRRATVRLCETCHVKRREEELTKKFLHPPVFEVGCTVCHDAHASDNPRRLRASINDLCLECHGRDGPPPPENGLVTVFGKVQIPAGFFRGMRKISVSGNVMRGHPLGDHPITGPNPLQPGGPVITCVTCHNPHASDFTRRRFQLKPGVKTICLNCHA